jgi:hypothetical protein
MGGVTIVAVGIRAGVLAILGHAEYADVACATTPETGVCTWSSIAIVRVNLSCNFMNTLIIKEAHAMYQ